jgi:hypothetical protein
MDTDDPQDGELIARLRKLDAATAPSAVSFGYETMIDRHVTRQRRARRRLAIARGTTGALVIALVGAGVWRFEQPAVPAVSVVTAPGTEDNVRAPQPRIVRADTYLAVAALEDHIASLDDALSVARLRNGAAEVARLERTRAELLDSYAQVRYAELVSANF